MRKQSVHQANGACAFRGLCGQWVFAHLFGGSICEIFTAWTDVQKVELELLLETSSWRLYLIYTHIPNVLQNGVTAQVSETKCTSPGQPRATLSFPSMNGSVGRGTL